MRLIRNIPRKLISAILFLIVFCCYYFSKKYVPPDVINKLNLSTNLGFRFIDINKLNLIHRSEICLYTKPKIVVLITSHVSNINTRIIIRRSRPRDMFKKFDVQLIFLTAILPNDEGRRDVEKEFGKYGDLVQGEFIEAYRNLTWKHLMGLRWVRDHCKSALYIVKMDDDIVVNFYKLFEIIHASRTNFDLLGHQIVRMKPIRNTTNKWYVSKEEYQDEEYPPFLSGWLYIMTMNAATLILSVSNKIPYFWIDDVLISGILREKAKLKLTDISHHFRYDPKNVECCIMNKYSCDFLAAPTGKNSMLHLKLSTHLWECKYKKRCLLESNLDRSCWFSANSAMTEEIRWVGKKFAA